MVAPVCHISPDQVITQPLARTLPNIPRATDLASALAAIDAIRQLLMTLTGQVAARPPDTPLSRVPQGSTAGGVRSQPPPKSNSNPQDNGRWTEASRVTRMKRIFNPDDKSQFVDVVQINKLVMRDGVTGEQWVWNSGDTSG